MFISRRSIVLAQSLFWERASHVLLGIFAPNTVAAPRTLGPVDHFLARKSSHALRPSFYMGKL